MDGESWTAEEFEDSDEEGDFAVDEDEFVDVAEHALDEEDDLEDGVHDLAEAEDEDVDDGVGLDMTGDLDHLIVDDDEAAEEVADAAEDWVVDEESENVGGAEELELAEAMRGLDVDAAEEAVENWLSADDAEGGEDLETSLREAEEEFDGLEDVDAEHFYGGIEMDEDLLEDATEDFEEEWEEASEEGEPMQEHLEVQ